MIKLGNFTYFKLDLNKMKIYLNFMTILLITVFLLLIYSTKCESSKIYQIEKLLPNILNLKKENHFFEDLAEPGNNSCISYYNDIATISSELINCVIANSRPFHVCKNCISYYLELNKTRKKIENDPNLYAKTLYTNGLKCTDIVEATDKVQIEVKVLAAIDRIWTNANCDGNFKSFLILISKLFFF